MAKFRIVLHTSNKRKDGSNPVCLRITKRGKLKYIDLKLSAFEMSGIQMRTDLKGTNE